MSEFMREALPIIFMYGCVLALGPFIGIAMWMAFDGDRLREPETTTTATAPRSELQVAHTPPVTAEATTAA